MEERKEILDFVKSGNITTSNINILNELVYFDITKYFQALNLIDILKE